MGLICNRVVKGNRIAVTESKVRGRTPQDVAFGECIRQWRQSKRMSQAALGEGWGKRSQSVVSSYELGETPVERRDLESLAAALGKPFRDVFDAWIECQYVGLDFAAHPRQYPAYILPSGIRMSAEDDGEQMEFSPDELLKIDREFQSIKARKKRL